MRIAIDAMGGDHAPEEIIKGAMDARILLDKDDQLILVGVKDSIESVLNALNADAGSITIVDAPEVIGMDEKPVESLRKKRKSSISVMAKMASKNDVDAIISAGNTGACVAASQLRMRNLEGVNRPGIIAILPTFHGPVALCDVGANISCKAINLYQYAVMSSVYLQQTFGIDCPRVGLMSIGEEDAKGNEIVKKTRDLLRSDPKINFIGNIEGRDIFDGRCDVGICEGFVGNIVLKLTEGLVDMIFTAIKHELMEENASLASEFKPIVERIYSKYDYHEYGGAVLLGVNGNVVICHGSSKSRTIKNAVLLAKKLYTQKINDKITEYLSNTSVRSNGD